MCIYVYICVYMCIYVVLIDIDMSINPYRMCSLVYRMCFSVDWYSYMCIYVVLIDIDISINPSRMCSLVYRMCFSVDWYWYVYKTHVLSISFIVCHIYEWRCSLFHLLSIECVLLSIECVLLSLTFMNGAVAYFIYRLFKLDKRTHSIREHILYVAYFIYCL